MIKTIFYTCVSGLFLFGCTTQRGLIEAGAKKLTDVRYSTHERNLMDVYLPANRDSGTPFVLLIHGGTWVMAGKENVRD